MATYKMRKYPLRTSIFQPFWIYFEHIHVLETPIPLGLSDRHRRKGLGSMLGVKGKLFLEDLFSQQDWETNRRAKTPMAETEHWSHYWCTRLIWQMQIWVRATLLKSPPSNCIGESAFENAILCFRMFLFLIVIRCLCCNLLFFSQHIWVWTTLGRHFSEPSHCFVHVWSLVTVLLKILKLNINLSINPLIPTCPEMCAICSWVLHCYSEDWI